MKIKSHAQSATCRRNSLQWILALATALMTSPGTIAQTGEQPPERIQNPLEISYADAKKKLDSLDAHCPDNEFLGPIFEILEIGKATIQNPNADDLDYALLVQIGNDLLDFEVDGYKKQRSLFHVQEQLADMLLRALESQSLPSEKSRRIVVGFLSDYKSLVNNRIDPSYKPTYGTGLFVLPPLDENGNGANHTTVQPTESNDGSDKIKNDEQIRMRALKKKYESVLADAAGSTSTATSFKNQAVASKETHKDPTNQDAGISVEGMQLSHESSSIGSELPGPSPPKNHRHPWHMIVVVFGAAISVTIFAANMLIRKRKQ